MNKTQELKDRIYVLNPKLKTTYHSSNNLRCTKCGDLDNYNHHGKCKVAEYEKLHLEHVLRAIQDTDDVVGISKTGEFIKDHYCGMSEDDGTGVFYDCKKTFDQNCADNPKLVDFLLEVIK